MTERTVMINVTKEVRDTIKILKKELTYDQYFSNLINSKKKKGVGVSISDSDSQITKSVPTKKRRFA